MAYKTVNKVFVGADIDRTLNVDNGVIAADILELVGEGEVILLNGDGTEILPAAPTIADSTTLRIGVGTSTTFTEGLLTYRELLVSDPIGSNMGDILLWRATAFDALTEKVATIDLGTFVPEAGEEYVIRIVYKDMWEHPGMYSQTYRYIARAGDLLADVVDAFVTLIMNDRNSRVNAANVADDLVLTAKHVPSNTVKYSIDEFRMVEFEVFLFSDNFAADAAITYTPKAKGTGSAALVRDAEKKGLSHRGITNRTQFPVPQAVSNMVVDMSTDYNLIQIHYNKPYQSANNQSLEHTQTSIELYTPVSVAGQTNDVLAGLDAWMVSAGMPTQAAAW